MRHVPESEQGRRLGQAVRGYLAYDTLPTNARAITSFVYYVTWHWKRALGRRSQKGRVNWQRMARIAARWLPPAKVRHPYPQQRFIVKYPRSEPNALAAHARICLGRAGGDPRPYRDAVWTVLLLGTHSRPHYHRGDRLGEPVLKTRKMRYRFDRFWTLLPYRLSG